MSKKASPNACLKRDSQQLQRRAVIVGDPYRSGEDGIRSSRKS